MRTTESMLAVLDRIKNDLSLIQTIARESPGDAALVAIKAVADLAYSDTFLLMEEFRDLAEQEQQEASQKA